MILNKKITDISGIDRTFFQLAVSAVVMLFYVLITEDIMSFRLSLTSGILLIILGVVHTGIVYMLFFASVSRLPTQIASILTYVDPVSVIFFSAIFLGQGIDLLQSLGTVLIIGAALINELAQSKK